MMPFINFNTSNMTILLTLLFTVPLSLGCRPEGVWHEEVKKVNKYFASSDSWGGWTPPENNDEWKKWIEMMSKYLNESNTSDEWGSERGPGSGWPEHWKGYGIGIGGIPPPPWAYVPESYDKPQYCFHMPRFGHCSENVTRWAFDPSRQNCVRFFYSGCGGSDNNFIDKARCIAACVDTAAPDCEDDPDVNLEEIINESDPNSKENFKFFPSNFNNANLRPQTNQKDSDEKK